MHRVHALGVYEAAKVVKFAQTEHRMEEGMGNCLMETRFQFRKKKTF